MDKKDILKTISPERTIFLDGEICFEKSNELVRKFFEMGQKSDRPIAIYFNTPGGDSSAGVVTANLYSAGMFPFVVCTKGYRFSLQHSKFYIHQPDQDVTYKINSSTLMLSVTQDLEKRIRETVLCKEAITKLLLSKTEIGEANLRNLFIAGGYFDAEAAKGMKIIDEII